MPVPYFDNREFRDYDEAKKLGLDFYTYVLTTDEAGRTDLTITLIRQVVEYSLPFLTPRNAPSDQPGYGLLCRFDH